MSKKYDNSRDVPTEALTNRLYELSDAVTCGQKGLDREFTMRIPPECDRDADLVLAESARRLRTSDTALAAAEARIAELLAREQREAERRKKQGVILDHAMRGLRNSAEHPDDGRMQAVRALAKHSERQAGRILALEKALEPFAREEVESMYKDPWHLQFSDPDGFVDFTDFTIGDLRRAAALLKEKE